MLARMAEVETKKLVDAQEMGQDQDQDTIMHDQVTSEQASGKGKDIIVDSTPPNSPVRTVRDSGSPSSAIPPAVQAALDDMKAEIVTFHITPQLKYLEYLVKTYIIWI
jgi:hypothetical protein